MTIETILAELSVRYGNRWPAQAVSEMLAATFDVAANPTAENHLRQALLFDWVTATVEAGLAFRQSTLIEH